MLRTATGFGMIGAVLAAVSGVNTPAMGCDEDNFSRAWLARGEPDSADLNQLDQSQVHVIDPVEFFERVVNRYRGLHFYKDTARVVQITERDGRESSRVETAMTCEISQGKLTVQTPASQARSGLKLNVPIKTSQPMRDAQLQYDLWLAPHMALKFAEQPLKNLRSGVQEGFTAVDAEPVMVDDKPMVHVELRSGDGLSEHCTAKFDLYVNSDSMLIERIEGQQRLPDGANYSTSVHITPTEHEPATASPIDDVEPFEPSEPIDPFMDEVPLDPVMPVRS